MDENESDETDCISLGEIIEAGNRNYGACDETMSCTYSKGYVSRQAVYACKTCYSITNKVAGICYPCSVYCHADHVLIDMYTKRNFRCDCGNSKFLEECKLNNEKEAVNEENKYNDNFIGLYCVCKQNEDDVDLDQWQCNICEDWFHLEHLCEDKSEFQNIDLDICEEFTCAECLKKSKWLIVYVRAQFYNIWSEFKFPTNNECLRIEIEKLLAGRNEGVRPFGVLWWTNNWREKLCRCKNCIDLAGSTLFLTNPDDSVKAYLKRSEKKSEDDDTKFEETLKSLPYNEAIVVAEGVGLLRDELKKMIEDAAENKNVITVDSVNTFYENLKEKTKRRFDGENDDTY